MYKFLPRFRCFIRYCYISIRKQWEGKRDQRERESTHGSQCWPPHRQRPSFPYNYSISSCAYSYVVAACRAESMVENGRYWNATYDRAGETRRRGTARSFQDIEEMNGIGCWAKLHSDNYLLPTLCLAPFAILKNNACHPIVQIIAELWHLSFILYISVEIYKGIRGYHMCYIRDNVIN